MKKFYLKAVAWRREEVEAGNKLVIWGIPIASVAMLFLIILGFAKWANSNSGFVTALSVFFSVPLAVYTANRLERQRLQKKVNIALHVLTHELWCNLNFVRQIEATYERNLVRIETSDDEGGPSVGYPIFPPRLSVFDKFIGEDHVFNLNEPLPMTLTEIYAQLYELRGEFFRWKDMMMSMRIQGADDYILLCQSILPHVEPVMRNMVLAWVGIVGEVGEFSTFPQIVETANIINEHKAKGGEIATAYKASWVIKNHDPMMPDGVIFCWVNDWPEAPVTVVELKDIASIHPSWVE